MLPLLHTKFLTRCPPFQLEERKVSITPTIGIAVYPLDASDAENLIKKADTAMYHGKERDGTPSSFTRRIMNISNLESVAMENHLRTVPKFLRECRIE